MFLKFLLLRIKYSFGLELYNTNDLIFNIFRNLQTGIDVIQYYKTDDFLKLRAVFLIWSLL